MTDFEKATLAIFVLVFAAIVGSGYLQVFRLQRRRENYLRSQQAERERQVKESPEQSPDDFLDTTLHWLHPSLRMTQNQGDTLGGQPKATFQSGLNLDEINETEQGAALSEGSLDDSEEQSEALIQKGMLKERQQEKQLHMQQIQDTSQNLLAEFRIQIRQRQPILKKSVINTVNIERAFQKGLSAQGIHTAVEAHDKKRPIFRTEMTDDLSPRLELRPQVPHLNQPSEIDLVHAESQPQLDRDLRHQLVADIQPHHQRVFKPLDQFDRWLEQYMPMGLSALPPCHAWIDISIIQPKYAIDIQNALYDLVLDEELDMYLFGSRVGQMTMNTDGQQGLRVWEKLEAGVPYTGVRITLRLAKQSMRATEEIIQHWSALAEKLARRLSGQLSCLPNLSLFENQSKMFYQLLSIFQQPLVVQLINPNGYWSFEQVHQAMKLVGAHLNQTGHYRVNDADGRPLYLLVNDMNNPKAHDFQLEYVSIMHSNILSMCYEPAKVTPNLEGFERFLNDAYHLSRSLQAEIVNAAFKATDLSSLAMMGAERLPHFWMKLPVLGVDVSSEKYQDLMAKGDQQTMVMKNF